MTVEIEGLTYRYKRSGFELQIDSLTVPKGEITAFIGPNGAGKTTLFKLIAGMRPPARGGLLIEGKPPLHFLRTGRLGLCLDSFPPDSQLSLGAWLRIVYASRAGIPWEQESLDEFADRVGVAELRGKTVGKMSRGQKRRAALALALCGPVDHLLLDEPAESLDPGSVMLWRELLKEKAEEGAAVMISSHILSELERLATRFVFLREGKVAHVCRAGEFSARSTVHLELSGWPAEVAGVYPQAHVEPLQEEGPARWRVKIPEIDDRSRSELVARLVRAGVDVMEVSSSHKSLEELFSEIVSQ